MSPLSNVSLHLSVAFLARIKKKKKEKKSPRTNRNDRFLPRSVAYSRPSLSFYHTIERKLYNHACASCSAPRYTIPRYQMRHSLTNANNLSNGKWRKAFFHPSKIFDAPRLLASYYFQNNFHYFFLSCTIVSL